MGRRFFVCVVKLFGNVSRSLGNGLRESEIAGKCLSADGLRVRETVVLEQRRRVAGVESGGRLVVDERGNEYLATTNDCCPHENENKGAALRGAVSFQLAHLAAEWGFGLLEAGAPMC